MILIFTGKYLIHIAVSFVQRFLSSYEKRIKTLNEFIEWKTSTKPVAQRHPGKNCSRLLESSDSIVK